MLLVDEEDAGQRLDNFLMRRLKGVPKTHVYRIIRSGEVRINKGRASADRRVAAGDQVRVPPVRTSQAADTKAQAVQAGSGFAPAREFPVLFEDENGRTARVGFELISATRDGRPEIGRTGSFRFNIAAKPARRAAWPCPAIQIPA